MATITQDMNYKQSLMKYATAHGVSKASRKYNRSRSYIYFWLKRWDGSVESLRPESRRPHHHPNQHTPAELKLIQDMRRRNPRLGMVELWCKFNDLTSLDVSKNINLQSFSYNPQNNYLYITPTGWN